ncbi:hypothetical protein R6G78_08990, partial [Actinotignum timonense]|uniref:hypothetical protein n=1 Tax=Actinotignum timonense TaxID=1870995 RepID=UPI002A814FD2
NKKPRNIKNGDHTYPLTALENRQSLLPQLIAKMWHRIHYPQHIFYDDAGRVAQPPAPSPCQQPNNDR